MLLSFENQDLQQLFKSELDTKNYEGIIIDGSIDEQNADDPLTLVLLITLAVEITKSVGKETISWFFEWLRKRLDKKKEEVNLPKSVEINIKVDDKEFRFSYNSESGEYAIEEIK